MRSGRKWRFRTARFTVEFSIERDHGYCYDGDDPDGEVQAKLDSGEYVAFDSVVEIYLDGGDEPIATDYLGGSVYADGEESEFWRAHWDSPAEYRNTLAQKAAGRVICHYFPDMVRQAIAEAREYVRAMPIPPYVRAV